MNQCRSVSPQERRSEFIWIGLIKEWPFEPPSDDSIRVGGEGNERTPLLEDAVSESCLSGWHRASAGIAGVQTRML